MAGFRKWAYVAGMHLSTSSRVRVAPGFIEPCLPSVAWKPPIGSDWVYEIKHDGYRLMVRKTDDRVRIYTRRGADWTKRFPLIVNAVGKLRIRSVLLDGEAIICRPDGMADFELLHSREHNASVTFCAFDLLEHEEDDVRIRPLSERKRRLADLLMKVNDGIQYNPHIAGDGVAVFEHACKLGCEGIVAKRIDLPYQSGRSKRWLKIKNPDSPAARRVDEGTF